MDHRGVEKLSHLREPPQTKVLQFGIQECLVPGTFVFEVPLRRRGLGSRQVSNFTPGKFQTPGLSTLEGFDANLAFF